MSLRKRVLVSACASALVFVFATITLIGRVVLGAGSEQSLTEFLQAHTKAEQFSGNLTFMLWALRVAVVVVTAYLVRLYLSLMVFDKADHYYREYLKPLPRAVRVLEWLVRLGVFAYLMLGLKGYETVTTRLIRFGALFGVSDLTGAPGMEPLARILIYVVGFYALLLLWDLILAVGAALGEQGCRLRRIWRIATRFGRDHLLGFVGWCLLLRLFTHLRLITEAPMFFGVVIFIPLALQFVSVFWSLIMGGSDGSGIGLAKEFSELLVTSSDEEPVAGLTAAGSQAS